MSARRFVEVDGKTIDTSSRVWMLICLARHICRMPAKDMRNGFTERLGKTWPAEAVEELRQVARAEWQRMYPSSNQKAETPAHDHA